MFRQTLTEFKTFAMRGNVIDLAVGVIIGGAFGQIVTSVVNDIVMPPIGLLLGGVDFKDLFWQIGATPVNAGGPVAIDTLSKAKEHGVAVIAYGQFINIILNFLIIAFSVFFMVKVVNKLTAKKKEEDAPAAAPTSKECPYCLSVIPIAASRCAHCTSSLEDHAGQAH
ncbi:large conductance mechanosensitive channel protein MscL [Cohnella nanjingensis]|uniref:Large-conductance mechanosensitive channel n=1 Tax=Cohnella nanjingensis TaxID=1387779 RepID=A0A7X0VJ95_9BACL|nr:large conductance mechanosensitive channel protein MscL [Cohnella nanjingensis]MBB6674484.1 large conductance mechanosensitive channel protein MscL [Cohnella nanjingensis]